MAINVVAYIGMENSDNIQYLSRILAKLGKKVLIVDHSDTLSLLYNIPKPQGVPCDQEIITYRHVDFTTMLITKDILTHYDDILISYGFKDPTPDIDYCNRFVFVTDLFSHNQERISSLSDYDSDTEMPKKALLIKEAVEMNISPEIVLGNINHAIPTENISILYRDDKDYSNSLICHYNRRIRFKDISKQLRNYLIKEIKSLYPDIDHKKLIIAYRQARKGD